MTKEEVVLQLTLAAMERNTRICYSISNDADKAAKTVGDNVALLFNTIWDNLTDGEVEKK